MTEKKKKKIIEIIMFVFSSSSLFIYEKEKIIKIINLYIKYKI